MKKYEVCVAGQVVTRAETKEEAERLLNEVRHSFLAMVHPVDVFYIRERA